MDKNMELKIKELKKGYLKKLGDMVLSFKAQLNDKNVSIEDLYQKVHSISGTSGMYGLSELSNESTEFEMYLKEIKCYTNSTEQTKIQELLLKYIETIEVTVEKGE